MCKLYTKIQGFIEGFILKFFNKIIKYVMRRRVELSKECRKEMQYYKLLAKEVEKRISILQPYVLDTDSSDEKTDASEIPECEQNYEFPNDVNVDRVEKEKYFDETLTSSPLHTELYNISPKVVDTENASSLIGDHRSTHNETSKSFKVNKRNTNPPNEVPERDYNCKKMPELLTDTDMVKSKQREKIIQSIVNYSFSVTRDVLIDSIAEHISQDGPQSLSSKSFTGSLNNLHSESSKESHNVSKLLRQRSYTLLNPSPQLLAHLEVQSLNTGVEMSCISMSDSVNNLSSPNKKRRSWDLESAKVKWSNMAKELKQKDMENPLNRNKYPVTRQPSRRTVSPQRAKSVNADRTRQNIVSKSPPLKTEPLYQPRKASPIRTPSNKTIVRDQNKTGSPKTNLNKKSQEPTSPKAKNCMPSKTFTQKKELKPPKSPTQKQIIPEPEDPATKVRELYEKIQKQQLMQMTNLVEKQKREQTLLQQVFEEQNNLLFKQLKTICPKSPIEVKQAWGDKNNEGNRGPVSLSQLINQKSPDHTMSDDPVSTLIDSNKYINHCDNVLKKSRDISSSMKKQGKSQSLNGNQIGSPRGQPESSRTRTNSPNRRNTPTSRRLNYDTSSSERDYEQILTDRTNDTMADLNVTFTSDNEDCRPFNDIGSSLDANELTVIHTSPNASNSPRSTDSAIKCMEQTIHNSMNTASRRKPVVNIQLTPKQITAACYSLHDTFITSSPSARCSLIAADRERGRRASFAARPAPKHRHSEL